MLNKLRKRMASEESGFTLVELLVVMLILGILAAIAIPTFFNQRDKARDSDAKVGARTAETAMETYATENGGNYGTVPATTEARLITIEPTLQASRLEVTYPAGAAYAVTYDSTNTPNTFTITRNTNGTKSASCATDGNDGCPPGGNWFAN
jgi:type IV pilus assembly protein PilA